MSEQPEHVLALPRGDRHRGRMGTHGTPTKVRTRPAIAARIAGIIGQPFPTAWVWDAERARGAAHLDVYQDGDGAWAWSDAIDRFASVNFDTPKMRADARRRQATARAVVAEKNRSFEQRRRARQWDFPEPPREPKDQRSVVYFVQQGTDGPVKIGTTVDLASRLRQLQNGAAVRLRVLVLLPGDFAYEARLHRRFAEYRMEGEWFRLDGELRAFVERAQRENPMRLRFDAAPPEGTDAT